MRILQFKQKLLRVSVLTVFLINKKYYHVVMYDLILENLPCMNVYIC